MFYIFFFNNYYLLFYFFLPKYADPNLYAKYTIAIITNNIINILKNLTKLQYIELSSLLQLTNEPKFPNTPDPIIPPFPCVTG